MLYLKISFRNVFKIFRRSFPTMLTLIIGVGSLFFVNGFITGILNEYREFVIHSRYGNGQINTKDYLNKIHEKSWNSWIKNSNEIEYELYKLPEVKDIFPRIEFSALLSNNNISVAGKGLGIDGTKEASFFTTINTEQGTELGDNKDGIVLGIGLARALNVTIGDHVTVLGNTIRGTLNGFELKVVGIFQVGIKNVDDFNFQIQLKKAQEFIETQNIETLTIGLKKIDNWSNVSNLIQKKFPNLEVTSFEVLDKVYYQNAVELLDILFYIIRSMILFAILIVIFHIFSLSIYERSHENTLLDANENPVKNENILLFIEALLIAIIGAIAGITLIYLINKTVLENGLLMPPFPGITRQFRILVELQWESAFSSFVLGVTTAVIAYILAGIRVIILAKAKTLRSI